MLAAQLRHHRACLDLLQDADDLFFRKLLRVLPSVPSKGRFLVPVGWKDGVTSVGLDGLTTDNPRVVSGMIDIFGEVSHGLVDAGALAEHTHRDKLPAVQDFAFRPAVIETVARKRGTDAFEVLFAFNRSAALLDRLIEVEPGTATARVLAGSGCVARVAAPGSLRVTLPAFGYAMCGLGGRARGTQ